MAVKLKNCPFCQCTMEIKHSNGVQKIDGDHAEDCIFLGGEPVATCAPGQENLEKMVGRWNTRVLPQKAADARGHVGNALNIVGQIRQGANVSGSELWDVCEYLDKALLALPRPD